MPDPHERTTLESIEAAIQDEFSEDGAGTVQDATLLVAGALVEIAKVLQFFKVEMLADNKRRESEEEGWRATQDEDEADGAG